METSREDKVIIVWNQVQTDRTIPNIQRDVRIRDHENGICTLIEVAISGGRNVIKKGVEKILKYKNIAIEIECT